MEDYIEIARRLSSKYTQLSPDALQQLASLMQQVSLKKGSILLDMGQIHRNMVYVDSGLTRQFYYKKGKDVTEHFGCEGTVVYCIHSLFGEQPTELMIEAIENSVVYNIDYKQLCRLCDSNIEISTMYRRLLEHNLRESQDKADSWRFESARERYERFKKDYPQAAKLASINDIASYLLMAPESLSRVRSGVL